MKKFKWKPDWKWIVSFVCFAVTFLIRLLRGLQANPPGAGEGFPTMAVLSAALSGLAVWFAAKCGIWLAEELRRKFKK